MKRIGIILLILAASALLTQGFQCASREMTTAKVKYNIKDWPTVRRALEDELSKRPQNDEAKVMLADVLEKQNEIPKLVSFIRNNQSSFVDPVQKDRFQRFVVKFWSESLYNKSTKFYAKYDKEKDKTSLDSAIKFMNYVYELRPELATIAFNIADYYKFAGNAAKEDEYLKKYISAIKPELDFAASKGFKLNTPRAELIKLLGKPVATVGTRSTRTDSSYIDKFNINGKQVITQSISNKEHSPQVVGWRSTAPDYWYPQEKEYLLTISLDPYYVLIQNYIDNNDDNSALEMTKNVLNIDPTNKRMNALLIELYQKLNKVDQAIASLNEQLVKEPKNTIALGQLGDIYRVTENYDKSIEAYKKAIEVDPKFTAAYLNLATSYKNKAGVIQAKQIKESDADPKYKFNPAEYEPLLLESAKYYTKVLESSQYENNLDIYKELINIYLVLNDKEKLAKAVAKIESLEETAKDKEQYYYDMIKIYGAMKDDVKRKAIQDKLEALNK